MGVAILGQDPQARGAARGALRGPPRLRTSLAWALLMHLVVLLGWRLSMPEPAPLRDKKPLTIQLSLEQELQPPPAAPPPPAATAPRPPVQRPRSRPRPVVEPPPTEMVRPLVDPTAEVEVTVPVTDPTPTVTGPVTTGPTSPNGLPGGTGKAPAPLTVDAANLDNPAVQPYGNRRPVYPVLARQAGIEGWVEVEVLVGTDGKVFQARVLKVEGHPSFGPATLEVARLWRFAPPFYKGERVQMRYVRKVAFRLKE